MNKLRSKRGESITEALAAVVVAALGSLLVAGSVMAAGRTMTKSDARMSVYYGQMNALAAATPTAFLFLPQHAAPLSVRFSP